MTDELTTSERFQILLERVSRQLPKERKDQLMNLCDELYAPAVRSGKIVGIEELFFMFGSEALITMGKIGVKVWIFKKELFQKSDQDLLDEARLVEKERIEELAKQTESQAAPAAELVQEPESAQTPELEAKIEKISEAVVQERLPKKSSPPQE